MDVGQGQTTRPVSEVADLPGGQEMNDVIVECGQVISVRGETRELIAGI